MSLECHASGEGFQDTAQSGSLRSDFGGSVRPGRLRDGRGGAMNGNDEDRAAVEEEFREIKGALLSDTVRVLVPDERLCVRETVTVEKAEADVMAMRRA